MILKSWFSGGVSSFEYCLNFCVLANGIECPRLTKQTGMETCCKNTTVSGNEPNMNSLRATNDCCYYST